MAPAGRAVTAVSETTAPGASRRPVSHGWIAAGLLLATLAAYLLSSPGRLDTIDGQFRYEVAKGIIEVGRPVVRDPLIVRMSLPGRDHLHYTGYGVANSLFGIPLVAIARSVGDPHGELARLFFSWLSPVFGALTAALLYGFYIDLRVEPRRALWWVLVQGFATLSWPTTVSAFDNTQHAFFGLLAVYLAWRSAARDAPALALAGGLAAGVLFHYQEAFGVVMPGLALATLGPLVTPRDRRRALQRYALFGAGATVGFALWLYYNYIRFGALLYSGKTATAHLNYPHLFRSPLIGLPGLLVSPGKSVFLYSPVLLLALFGLRALWRQAPRLGLAIVAASGAHVLLVSWINWWAGDWCWGPRYLVLPLTLFALALPFVPPTLVRPRVAAALVALGLLVQLMAVSMDAMRFFTEQRLSMFFWSDDPWFYFKHSGLLARPGEIVSALRDGVPHGARFFAPTWDLRDVTSCPIRRWSPSLGPFAMRDYSVYYLPRPWPFWMRRIPEWQRPFDPAGMTATLLAVLVVGVAMIRRGLRRR